MSLNKVVCFADLPPSTCLSVCLFACSIFALCKDKEREKGEREGKIGVIVAEVFRCLDQACIAFFLIVVITLWRNIFCKKQRSGSWSRGVIFQHLFFPCFQDGNLLFDEQLPSSPFVLNIIKIPLQKIRALVPVNIPNT